MSGRDSSEGLGPRVLVVSHSSQIAGAEKHAAGIVEELQRRGARSPVLVVPAAGPLVDRVAATGVVVEILPFTPWGGARRTLLAKVRALTRSLLAGLRLARWVRLHDVDVIVTNTIVVPPIGAVAGLLTRRPHIWFATEQGRPEHGVNFDWGRSRTLSLVGRTGTVVAISQSVVDAIAPPLKAERIHLVDCVVERPDHPRLTDVGKSGGTPLRVLTVGMKNPGKHQEDLIRALGLLRSEGRDIRLALVGYEDPDYTTFLRELAAELDVADLVTMAPFVEDVDALYAASHVHVTCSRDEGLGSATVEAMAHGMPVVGARSGGTPEIVEDGVTGFLFEPGDHVALARNLAVLDDDRELAASLGRAGAAVAATRCTPASVVDELLDVVAALLRPSAGDGWIGHPPDGHAAAPTDGGQVAP